MTRLSLKDFSYTYPEELVAKYPANPRDSSRLLVVSKNSNSIEHKNFTDIIAYFQEGDVLVMNNSKVFPCRLITQRKSGGRQEIFLIRRIDENAGRACPVPTKNFIGNICSETWSVMLNSSGKVKHGDVFHFEELTVTILEDEGNLRKALLEFTGDLYAILNRVAHMPLPPYINRIDEASDHERYQTVYAKDTGSVAAPTAGLHFTPELIAKLIAKGIIVTEVTLHVGLGTFLPVKTQSIEQHEMHSEYFSISQVACDVLNLAKKEGRRITALGTTSTRVLETIANNVGAGLPGPLAPMNGTTNIFIYPPYKFQLVDRIITNFHQPESTLLMLVSAFAGREEILSAYQEAIQKKYRLFSYGDAMLIG